MKPIVLGVLAGLLLAFPALLDLLLAAGTGLVSRPWAVAFVLGLIVRPYLPLPRRLR
jgi:hypothetical protein